MEWNISPTPSCKRRGNVTQDREVRPSSRDSEEVFLELPCVPSDVWGGNAHGRTHICSRRQCGSFLHSQHRGPSHMGRWPKLTGFLGLQAVWVLVYGVPDMATFTADV